MISQTFMSNPLFLQKQGTTHPIHTAVFENKIAISKFSSNKRDVKANISHKNHNSNKPQVFVFCFNKPTDSLKVTTFHSASFV